MRGFFVRPGMARCETRPATALNSEGRFYKGPIFAAVRRCAFGSGNATHEVRLGEGADLVGPLKRNYRRRAGVERAAFLIPERGPGVERPAGRQQRKRDAVDCTAAQAVPVALLANGMGNTGTASGPRPRLRSGRSSAHC